MSIGVRPVGASARLVATVGLLFLSTGVGPVSAQVAEGDRIRVRTIDRALLVGRLEQFGADSLILTDAGGTRRAVARPVVTQLEVSRGRHTRVLAGAAVGSLTGLVVGAAVGLAADADEDAKHRAICQADDSRPCGKRWFDNIEVAAGAVVGGGVGLLAGGIVGSFAVERWRAVPLTERVSLRSWRDGVGVSVRF